MLVAGAFQPWVILYGAGQPAMAAGGGADEAVASALLIVAGIDVAVALYVLVVARRQHRARFLHAVATLLSALILVVLLRRIQVDEHQTFLARMDPDGAQSYLGDGIYLVCIGLAVCAAAPFVALPEMVRALRS